MSFQVEKGLITKVLETRDINTLKENQIKSDFFFGDNRTAFQYILDQVQATGVVPTVRAFRKRFPKYSLDYKEVNGEEIVGNEENLLYWCNEIRKKVKHNSIVDIMGNVSKALDDLNADEAYSIIKKGISHIELDVVKTSAIDITDTADRKQAYLNKQKTGGMIGLPTGFKLLDYMTKGLAPQTLTTILAYTGVGKTFFECLLGAYLQLEGYKVLQLITEMSDEIMRDRYEAILYAKCCGEFNYNEFKSGKLPPKVQETYFDFLDNILPNLEPLIVDTATSPLGVSAQIEKYNPDIVLIDSAYLMEDDKGSKDDWLRYTHITRDLKLIAKSTKKPLVINTQADKNTSKKTGPELASIMYTQSIGQDCLPKDTLILTDTGYKRIQYLENEVFNVFDGENTKKAYCTKTGLKDRVQIKYRGNIFTCSPEHKIYVYDEEVQNFVWKKAKDIQPKNDYLLEQDFITEQGHSHVLKYEPKIKSYLPQTKPINIPTDANFELGQLIGMFIGDGSVKPIWKGQVSMSCGQDIEYAELCIRLVKNLFDLDGDITTIKSSTSKNDELLVVWYSVQFAQWLDYFINDEESEKTVKLDYSEMNLEFRKGIVSGLLQSDGSCISQVDLSSSQKSVIQGFNMLCKTFGVVTRYDFNLNESKGKRRIRIPSFDLYNFGDLKLVGYKSKQFNDLVNAKNSGRLPKPKSYIKSLCNKNRGHLIYDTLLYKTVLEGARTGKIGQKYLSQISDIPYKFIQVDEIKFIKGQVEMWDIQVYDSDKRIVTNGIVTHNSDNIWALFRDQTMISDREMCLKLLKQREGTLGKLMLNWDFERMNFSGIYSEQNSSDNDNTIEVQDD